MIIRPPYAQLRNRLPPGATGYGQEFGTVSSPGALGDNDDSTGATWPATVANPSAGYFPAARLGLALVSGNQPVAYETVYDSSGNPAVGVEFDGTGLPNVSGPSAGAWLPRARARALGTVGESLLLAITSYDRRPSGMFELARIWIYSETSDPSASQYAALSPGAPLRTIQADNLVGGYALPSVTPLPAFDGTDFADPVNTAVFLYVYVNPSGYTNGSDGAYVSDVWLESPTTAAPARPRSLRQGWANTHL